MVELRQHAKFRQNRLNRGRDMAIFRFFEDGGRRHLGFLKFQTVGRIVSVELPYHAKFRGDRSNRCRDISILAF